MILSFVVTAVSLQLAAAAIVVQVPDAEPSSKEFAFERQMTQVLFEGVAPRGARASIEYGSPIWREEYEARVNGDGSDALRLGKDDWTLLMNSVEIQVGDTRLASGFWYLGLRRSEESGWSLLVFDALDLLGRGVVPSRMWRQKVHAEFPLSYSTLPELCESLRIRFRPVAAKSGSVELTVDWGHHRLSAEWRLDVGPAESGVPEFRVPGEAAEVTATGLRFERVREGDGPAPGPGSTAVVHYTLWREDGTLLDSTHARDEPAVLPPGRIASSWVDALASMKVGAACRFLLPGKSEDLPGQVLFLELLELER